MPGSILCPHPSRLRRATFPKGEGFGEKRIRRAFYSFSFSANLRVTSAHRWAASRSKVG